MAELRENTKSPSYRMVRKINELEAAMEEVKESVANEPGPVARYVPNKPEDEGMPAPASKAEDF